MPSSDTQIKKGMPKRGGRVKGTPNKATTKIKEAVMAAFDKVGGVKYLIKIANDDPGVFCNLLAKILPTEIKAEITVNETLSVRLEQARLRAINTIDG
jgi:hypothetical protein